MAFLTLKMRQLAYVLLYVLTANIANLIICFGIAIIGGILGLLDKFDLYEKIVFAIFHLIAAIIALPITGAIADAIGLPSRPPDPQPDWVRDDETRERIKVWPEVKDPEGGYVITTQQMVLVTVFYLLPVVCWGIFIDLGQDRFGHKLTNYNFIYAPIAGLAAAEFISLFFTRPSTLKSVIPPPEPPKPKKIVRPITVLATGDQVTAMRDTHGKAKWISDGEKEALSAYRPPVLTEVPLEQDFHGLWIGGGFFDHQDGNLLTLAPPGFGKGAALIIPNLLLKRDYLHSFVVFDPKGTNTCITARFQKEMGRTVIIIDPMNLQKDSGATHGIPSSCYNPLDGIKNDLFNGTMRLVHLLLPDDPKATDKYWNAKARDMMNMLIHYIMLSPGFKPEQKNLVTLYKLMTGADMKVLLLDILKNEHVNEHTKLLAQAFTNMILDNSKMYNSVLNVAGPALSWIGNPALQECLSRSDFDPADLDKGNMTIYICQPLGDEAALAVYSRLIVSSCLRENIRPSAQQKAWVYYMLDEFPNVGVFNEVINALPTAREYKMRIWLFAQGFAQIEKTYDKTTREYICATANIIQGFNLSDYETAKYLSERAGRKTVPFYTHSDTHSTSHSTTLSESSTSGTSTGPDGKVSYSSSHTTGKSETFSESHSHTTNTNYHSWPLIAPEEFQFDQHIISISHYGPMRLRKWQYWERHNIPGISNYYTALLEGRADHNPNFIEAPQSEKQPLIDKQGQQKEQSVIEQTPGTQQKRISQPKKKSQF